MPRSFPGPIDVHLTESTQAFFADPAGAPSGFERTQPLRGRSLRLWERVPVGWRSRRVGLLLVLAIGVVGLPGLPVGPTDGPTEPAPKVLAVTRDEVSSAGEPLPSLVEKKPPIRQAQPSEPCTHLGIFKRERCLWKQCETARYRGHAVCARFR
ncbi:hypothetical protein D9M68_812930 [compost metagenome]